ncbi:MAG: hydantoinase/oxoprolinase family protein, partial [Pseudomonas sp.]|nr:hydantoinase/oxoprolinase family protein [Pseudomonas sp.]
CAYGDATTRVKDEASRSLVRRVSDMSVEEVVQILQQLGDSVRSSLAAQDIPAEVQQLTWQADVRYQGQALLLTLDIDPDELTRTGMQAITAAFDAEHEQLFTFALNEAHEVVNLRAIARAPRPEITERAFESATSSLAEAQVGHTPVHYAGQDYDAALYARGKLSPGLIVPGPAIVMEMDSTTLVLPGYEAAVDRVGNLLIRPLGHQE